MSPSKPERIAQQIEAMGVGWAVERVKEGRRRTIEARRPNARGGTHYVRIAWERQPSGRDVLVGDYSVAKTLRAMAQPSSGYIATLPDDEVRRALEGRTLIWRNSITGRAVKRWAVKVLVARNTATGADRQICFTDPEYGFQAVRLSSIEEIR